MNVIKVVLGFLELAFALKFLSVADLAYGWRLLDRETFLALWIVIFGLLGFYLLGKIKFPHDDDSTKVGVGRFFLASVRSLLLCRRKISIFTMTRCTLNSKILMLVWNMPASKANR